MYLRQHPDIYMSDPKEPHFFSNDEAFRLGLEGYRQLFIEGQGNKYRGESSTTYMIFPRVAERIKATIPDPRFIFVLRNPIDRVWSHYRWLKETGSERRPLRQAFLADLDDEPDFNAHVDGNFLFYGLESRYGFNLRGYYNHFDADRIMVITAEHLRDDPNATLRQCTDLLELPSMTVERSLDENRTPPDRWQRTLELIGNHAGPTARMNRLDQAVQPLRSAIRRSPSLAKANDRLVDRLSKQGYSRLSSEDRQWLRSFFVDDVAEVRELTNQSLSEWEEDFPLAEPHRNP
jgi:hypothetical protein